MKKLILLLPALVLLTAAHGANSSSDTQAMNMLKKFYKSYIAEMSKNNPDEYAVQALIEKNTTESFRYMMEESNLGYDVFTWSQDYDRKWAKSLKVDLSDNSDWMYKVSIRLDPDSQIPMWIDVVYEEGRWLIDNIDNLHLGSDDDDYESDWETGYTETNEFVFLEYNGEGEDARIFVLAPYSYTMAIDLVNKLEYEPDLCRGDKISVTWEIGETTEDEDGEEDYVIWASEIESVKFGPVAKFRKSRHASVEYSLRGDWTESDKTKYTGAVEYFLATTEDDGILEALQNADGMVYVTVEETVRPAELGDDECDCEECAGATDESECKSVWLSVGIQSSGSDIVPAGGIVVEYGEYGKATYYRLKQRTPFYYEHVDIDADF